MIDEIDSIINGNSNALDKDKAFTFIEFIKCFGFENNPDSFLTLYKEYLNAWAEAKSVEDIAKTKDQYVRERMIDTLKSITLTYSSYEEQDFIVNLNWGDEAQVAALVPLYARKIKQICEFYRKKRNEAPIIVRKHNTKGSVKSIEQIVYDKIVDFVFENKNLLPQYVNIRRDLSVSVENYVDTYSEYFDIPRKEEFTDKSRKEMLEANMNDVDYRAYLEITELVSDILYSGDMYLKEIPLIARVGLNLADECIGDLAEVKNELLTTTVINLIPLNEQVELKRKLYEKYLGCDLYYMYCDSDMNTRGDLLCKAKNPTGNLLNCGTADTATVESDSLELLSNIGLYFKPDKCGIIKVSAKDYNWKVDRSLLQPDTMYVFPDPNMYGDIGTNKSEDYPLLMEFSLDYDIKNFSSGVSKNDPINLLGSPGWNSYYSKQDDIFATLENKNFEYAFTSLANLGYIHSFQEDVYGNQFALLKGVSIEPVIDEKTGKKTGKIEVTVPEKFGYSDFQYSDKEDRGAHPLMLNGGYFADPFKAKTEFNFKKYQFFNENYKWSAINPVRKNLILSPLVSKYVKCGNFGIYNGLKYVDHFRYTNKNSQDLDDDSIVEELIDTLFTQLVDESEIIVKKEKITAEQMDSMPGTFYVRNGSSFTNKPEDIKDAMPWLRYDAARIWDSKSIDFSGDDIISFDTMRDVIVLETSDKVIFLPYMYNGDFSYDKTITEVLHINKEDTVATRRLYDEDKMLQYILQLRKFEIGGKQLLIPFIYEFNPAEYTLREVIDPFDIIFEEEYGDNDIRKEIQLAYNKNTYAKTDISEKIEGIKAFLGEKEEQFTELYLNSDKYNIINFEYVEGSEIGENSCFVFSKNNGLDRYLLSFIHYDKTGMPYIYEHVFKILNNIVFDRTLTTNVYKIMYKDGNGEQKEREYKAEDGLLETLDGFFTNI